MNAFLIGFYILRCHVIKPATSRWRVASNCGTWSVLGWAFRPLRSVRRKYVATFASLLSSRYTEGGQEDERQDASSFCLLSENGRRFSDARDKGTSEVAETGRFAHNKNTKCCACLCVSTRPPPLLLPYFFVSPLFFYISVCTSVCFHSRSKYCINFSAITVGFW